MKKLFQLCALVVLGGGLASASIIFSSPCSALASPNQLGVASGVCSATADAGFFLNSVTVTITSDYTGYQSGTPTVTNTYSYLINDPGFGAIPNGIVTTSGVNSVSVQNFNQTVNGNFGSFAQVQLSMNNSVSNGAVTGVSGVMTLTATELPVVGGVPEPTTMVLLGSGLVGLAVAKRRRRAKV